MDNTLDTITLLVMTSEGRKFRIWNVSTETTMMCRYPCMKKEADENSRRRVLMLKMYFFPLLCVSLRYIQNYIAVNNRGKSDMFVVTASMLLWRYELKWIYSCGMYIQCTWKLRKFVWRTDRRRRLLWRNVTCLKLPDKVLASTVAVCKTFQHICVYWNVRRIGLWNTARKVTCIVVMKIVIRELTSKVTAYVVSSRGAIQHHILAFPPITMARGLRRGSAVARLLGLRIWIPPDAWMSCLLWEIGRASCRERV